MRDTKQSERMPEKAISLTGPKSDEEHRWCRVQSECRSGTDVERRLNNDTGTTDTALLFALAIE